MPRIAAYEDVQPDKIISHRGTDEDHPSADVFPLIGRPKDPGRINAFVVRYLPGSTSSTHYHTADQIQIVIEGKGRVGRHEMRPYHLHFSRAYTPYGPLVPVDPTEGWAFVNLRIQPDAGGAQRLSSKRDQLLQVPGRRPFQMSCEVVFPEAAGNKPTTVPIAGLLNDEGLSGIAVTLPPGSSMVAPSPAGGDGQYVLVVEGSLANGDKVHQGLSVVHLEPDEPPYTIQAGAEGLKAMVLNFPRTAAGAAVAAPAAVQAGGATASKVWRCMLCDFTYDEAKGMPDEGVVAGTRWEDVPEAWNCPDCGASKADFDMVEA